MPGIIWVIKISSIATPTHWNRNWASAYAAGVAINSVRITVPEAMSRLVTRLRPWSCRATR